MTLHYQFPIIRNISDVLPAIKDRKEFIVAVKDGYTVINYVVAGNDTFPSISDDDSFLISDSNYEAAILRECRGIIFDNETGNIIARRFHKFFNVGEREDMALEHIDLTRKHTLPIKLDGSMITPIPLASGIRWGTKMGITDVSMQAEEFVADKPNYQAFAKRMTDLGYTPIFEWCSNKQRIVVNHEVDNLILLAIRENMTGVYVDRVGMEFEAKNFNIPLVKLITIENDTEKLISRIRGWDQEEGIVIAFEDGHMAKIKSDWYVRLHKTKDAISSERKVLDLILNGNIDDLKPLMDEDDFSSVVRYETQVMDEIYQSAGNIYNLYWYNIRGKMDRKTFAVEYMTSYPNWAKFIFNLFEAEGRSDPTKFNESVAYALVCDDLIKKIKMSTSNNKSFDEAKAAFFWKSTYNYGVNIDD